MSDQKGPRIDSPPPPVIIAIVTAKERAAEQEKLLLKKGIYHLRHLSRRQRHRYEPRRNAKKEQAARDRLAIALRERQDAERLKRLSVTIRYVVPISDGKEAWSVELTLVAPPPKGAVSEFNRFIGPGKDWWNDAKDPRCYQHIVDEWRRGPELRVYARPTGPKGLGPRDSRWMGESMAVWRWALKGDSAEMNVRRFIAATAVMKGAHSQNQHLADDVAHHKLCDMKYFESLPAPTRAQTILDSVLPAYNDLCAFNPFTGHQYPFDSYAGYEQAIGWYFLGGLRVY